MSVDVYVVYVCVQMLETEGRGEKGREEEGEGELGGGEGDKRAGVLLGVVLCLHKKIPAQGIYRMHRKIIVLG